MVLPLAFAVLGGGALIPAVVVTQTLVAEGGGKWREYVGGYSDWLAQRPAPAAQASGAAARATKQPSREAQKVKRW